MQTVENPIDIARHSRFLEYDFEMNRIQDFLSSHNEVTQMSKILCSRRLAEHLEFSSMDGNVKNDASKQLQSMQ